LIRPAKGLRGKSVEAGVRGGRVVGTPRDGSIYAYNLQKITTLKTSREIMSDNSHEKQPCVFCFAKIPPNGAFSMANWFFVIYHDCENLRSL